MMPIRRALALELRLNSGRFATSVLLCALSLIVAATITDALMVILPIWAALAWFRYGRADTVERGELRASLGLSRADRVRGRVVLIGVESAILVVIGTLWLLIAPTLDLGTTVRPGPTFGLSGTPELSEAVLVGVGTVQSILVLLLTAIGVGGDCMTRRPPRSLGILSIAVYLGAGLLSAVIFGLPMALVGVAGASMVPYLLAGGFYAVLCVVLALVLSRRVRAWIRYLDSGVPARLAAEA